MKKLVIGILAHVDAGKTSLSESMLYLSGAIRRAGRVDNKDAYLDTNEIEKLRGITIFSKQALFNINDTQVILMDTPGHVDFSAEMERTLQILDYAILVISGTDGVQGHTKTLWRLLESYDIPTFIFVNKMDQPGNDKNELIDLIKGELSEKCILFDEALDDNHYEQLAILDDAAMDQYIDSDQIAVDTVRNLVLERKVFPTYFGSALKQIGVDTFLSGIDEYTVEFEYPDDFGAKVFKITRDNQGNRLTHMKITGGTMKVKDMVGTTSWEEKVNQIRIYSGDKFEGTGSVEAGSICAVTGLSMAKSGDGLGFENPLARPKLEPVLSYGLILPHGIDGIMMMPKLRILEEEDPELKIEWNQDSKDINIKIMGEVQLEVLESIILDRFDVHVSFGEGKIVYKETISNVCEGVGHFEPLKHYAEVHLLLEAGERGSGLVFDIDCSEEMLEKNWQRLVMTHLKEKNHIGVLAGAPITDMKITLVAGKAHNRHTVGGDFREATFRALRQGLKEANSVVLEPYYTYRLELPSIFVGRAMTDIDSMGGSFDISRSDEDISIINGVAPVSAMGNYHREVIAYTKGHGSLFTELNGYEICKNQELIIDTIGYDPDGDLNNPTGSIFCSNGSGFTVPWDEVKSHMHVESHFNGNVQEKNCGFREVQAAGESEISLEEIDQIMSSTFYSNQGKKSTWKRPKSAKESYYGSPKSETSMSSKSMKSNEEEYLLIDGYNIIFAWDGLNKLANENLDLARTRLLDILCNYRGLTRKNIVVVFDAYRVENRKESLEAYNNIHVVYTGEAQTADQYIEKFVHANQEMYRITVATSDGLEQVIIRGLGCLLLSARELENEVNLTLSSMNEEHLNKNNDIKVKIEDTISDEMKAKIVML